MTQLRVGRSVLNDHRFPIGQSETVACGCSADHRESTKHVLLKCSLYTPERQILLGKVGNLTQTLAHYLTTDSLTFCCLEFILTTETISS